MTFRDRERNLLLIPSINKNVPKDIIAEDHLIISVRVHQHENHPAIDFPS